MDPDNTSDPDSVHSLRTRHGLSMEALAKHCALSIRQLRQIEDGGDDAFYSPAIKQLAVRKVMTALHDEEGMVRLQNQPCLSAQPTWSPRVLQFKAPRVARHA